jgi:hypothetical protein
MTHRPSSYIPRRAVLAGIGATAAGMFMRPLFASAADASPTRLLIVHRPCGTRPEVFFPIGGDNKNFSLDFSAPVNGVTIPSITKSFIPLIPNMVLLNGITCPRDHSWAGDQHSAGLISMMTGKRFISIPGTPPIVPPYPVQTPAYQPDSNAKNVVADGMSIDQMLLGEAMANLGGRPIPSIQSTAYPPSAVGLPAFRVMSYKGSNQPLFPESRSATLFNQIFGSVGAGLSPDALARMQTQNTSILDFVNKDLTRLRGHVPSSQFTKLDAHLDSIAQLEKAISASTAAASCAKPSQLTLPTPTGDEAKDDDAMHLANAKNQLGIISAAFQCDLTRVATFTFAHGNSALEFSNIDQNFSQSGGHHDISHNTSAGLAQARIDQTYCETLAALLTNMSTIPDGSGTLLDNTLVVFFNEVSDGNSHSITNMPVAMFGGKKLGLQTGQHLHFNGRYMNDVWSAIAGAFGVTMKFGDSAYSTGPVASLFG